MRLWAHFVKQFHDFTRVTHTFVYIFCLLNGQCDSPKQHRFGCDLDFGPQQSKEFGVIKIGNISENSIFPFYFYLDITNCT